MAKFTLDQKITVVNEYLQGNGSLRSIGKKHNTDHKRIQMWVALFHSHGLEGLISRYTNYSGKFKMDVLTYMNDTGSSLLETAAAFNISAPSTILKWRSILAEKGVDALYDHFFNLLILFQTFILPYRFNFIIRFVYPPAN